LGAAGRGRLWPSWFSDAAGRERNGGGEFAGYSVAACRNGELVAEADRDVGFFTVPAESGRYEIKIRAKRSKPYELSTLIDAAWTFDSANRQRGDTVTQAVVRAYRLRAA
jgi:hypothetical protein